MAWTYETIRDYVNKRGENADERYLIEAIEDLTDDPKVGQLINDWFRAYRN